MREHRRTIGILVLGACAWGAPTDLRAEAGSLQVKLEAGEYNIIVGADGREQIEMTGFGHLSAAASPKLPSRIFLVAIPPGVKVTAVRLTPAQAVPVPGVHRIAPARMTAPMSATSEELAQLEAEYAQQLAAMEASDEIQPGEVAQYVGPGAYRKYNLVQIRFTPFAYRPQSGSLSLHPSVGVTVEYADAADMAAEAALMNSDNNLEVESLAREMVINYDSIQASYPAPPALKQAEGGEIVTATTTGFVIVTSNALQTAVAPIANWERCKGRSVYVRTVEAIETSYAGDDRAEKIRNFLRDKLAVWNILYVMLIGDHDTVPMCPAYKEGPCGWGDPDICWETLDYTPTDYYYAELSLPDSQSWDSHDLEAIPTRGEQAYDLIQFPNEVNVGRIPLNDPVEVEAICRRMANYEYSSDLSYKYRYLFASSFYWPNTDSATVSEYFINHDLLPAQYLPVRIYERDTNCYQSSYASQYDMSTTIIKQVWSNQFGDGYFGFVNLMGHGNPSCQGYRGEHPNPAQCPSANMFCRWDNSVLSNDYPAMVYGNGCSTAELEVADNLPRHLLRRGAVGFIGPTRNALGTQGWQTPSDGSSQSLNYWFCHYAVTQQDTRSTFGVAFQAALRHMYNDHGWNNDWGQFFEWNFFGNPDMSINPRPANLPDLEFLTPPGWTFPVVPRSTGDATSSSCLLTGTLPGNTDDTYLNFAFRNAGGTATPTHLDKLYVDDRELLSKSLALGAGNSSLRINETSAVVIPGGRHTLACKLDTGEMVWEASEADNCWARQFVWSPPLLADGQPLNMAAPPREDAWWCAAGTTYPNCDGFAFDVWPTYPTAGHQWSVIAVSRPTSEPFNLRLWNPGSYSGSLAGFGAGSVFGPTVATACDWIVVNGAAATRGTYYLGVSGPTEGSVDYRVEKTSSVPIEVGTNGPFAMTAGGGAVQLFEIDLPAGNWRILVDQGSSTSDLGATVYSQDASIAGRTGTGVLASVNQYPAGADETLDVTIPAAGKYAVAIWKAGVSDFSKTASYHITVGVGGAAGVPSNPSPADGATGRSVATDLDWADCANATSYRVYMRPAGAATFDIIGTVTASTIDPGVLEYNTTYEWYVLACNVWNQFTLGPTWTFTTMTEPDLVVLNPNGGETWGIGQVVNIEWTSNNCRGLIDILLSRSGGAAGTWETLANNVGLSGSFPWTVTGPVSSQCRVKILGGVCTDTSDADFSIVYPAVTVTSPNGGDIWYTGESKMITWTSEGIGPNVRIDISRDNGLMWSNLVASTPNNGRYKWTVTTPTSSRCLMRVSDAAQPSWTDVSDASFSIRTRSITVTSPNGGQNWPVRSSQDIAWTSVGITGTLRIELSRDAGASWNTLADDVPAASPWTWPFVTPLPSSECLVRVSSLAYPSVSDSSNLVFEISCDVAPDTDGDCDVDWDDWLAFEACATGPSVSYQSGLPENCGLTTTGGLLRIDFDADADVDQDDFAVFQRCYSGADPADPACAN